MACLSAGASAVGSLAETTMAFTCCAVRLLIKVTWSAALAVDGPTCLNDPFSSVAAFIPPLAAVSKYGLLMALGRKTTLRLFPLLELPPPVVLEPPPQAARSSTAKTKKPDPSVRNSFFTVSSSFILSYLFGHFPRPAACGIERLEYAGRYSVPGPRRLIAYQ